MTIYIYVKTHNKTGLKYLGQTSSNDPHKYYGSGKYWKRHLTKHGFDYTTEILKECINKDEVKFWGEYYSNLWNVVYDPGWANLKKETGDGGQTRTWNKGKTYRYWTNGEITVANEKCPGKGWTPKVSPLKGKPLKNKSKEAKSRSGHKGTSWWNNGSTNKRSVESPGAGWIRGFAAPSSGSKGMRWWNNSVKSVLSLNPPGPEWVLGRI